VVLCSRVADKTARQCVLQAQRSSFRTALHGLARQTYALRTWPAVGTPPDPRARLVRVPEGTSRRTSRRVAACWCARAGPAPRDRRAEAGSALETAGKVEGHGVAVAGGALARAVVGGNGWSCVARLCAAAVLLCSNQEARAAYWLVCEPQALVVPVESLRLGCRGQNLATPSHPRRHIMHGRRRRKLACSRRRESHLLAGVVCARPGV
jgi:hypothetical protein